MSEVNRFKIVRPHTNVVAVIETGNGNYQKISGKNKSVYFIALETGKVRLLDSITTSGKFEEPLARYFFRQLINGLGHLHTHGIAHGELKSENLLLDD